MGSPCQDTSKETQDEGEYWSCDWLEGGLAFLPQDTGVHVCCLEHHRWRGKPLLMESYVGGKLPISRILDARSKIIRENQLPEHHPMCRGCHFLVKWRWSHKSHPIDHLFFGHWTKCNCKCVYCYETNPEFRPPDVQRNFLPTLEEMLLEGYLSPHSMVTWAGGEPTLLAEFDDMFELLCNYGVTQVISSNGVLLSETILQWLPQNKVQVVITVDAGKRETYRAIKQIDACDRVWSNLAEYARVGGTNVSAKIIFTPHNVSEVPEIMERVKAAKIKLLIADVDLNIPVLDEEIIQAAALLAYECRRMGVKFEIGPAQQVLLPDNSIKSRVEKACRERVRKLNIGARLLWIMGEMDGSLRPINSGLLLDLLKRSWRSWLEVGFIGTLKNTIRFARKCHTRLLSQ